MKGMQHSNSERVNRVYRLPPSIHYTGHFGDFPVNHSHWYRQLNQTTKRQNTQEKHKIKKH